MTPEQKPLALIAIEDTVGGKRAIDKCPWCDREVEHLVYEREVTEKGTCEVDGTDRDDDYQETNSIEYSCPHCYGYVLAN